MLARLQQLIVLAVLASSASWVAYFTSHDRPMVACLGGMLMLAGYALFLGVEFVLMYGVHDGAGPAPRPRVGQILRAWGGEIVTAPQVFFWRQPFRANAEPDNLRAPPQPRRGVVLVHGFVCNRGLWNPWMRELRLLDVPFVAVNLEPVFGSIDRYVQTIEHAVQRVEAATGLPAVLVGHSMGGLAIRSWLMRPGARERVARVITIGSPHQGTWLARYGHTRNGRQMRPNNAWLAKLRDAESASLRKQFTCFFGHCDNIVFPVASATLDGAHNVHVAQTAHVRMLFHALVFNEVCRWTEPGPTAEDAVSARAALAK